MEAAFDRSDGNFQCRRDLGVIEALEIVRQAVAELGYTG